MGLPFEVDVPADGVIDSIKPYNDTHLLINVLTSKEQSLITLF